MAWVEKYYIDVYDNTGNQYKVKIYEDAFGGSTSELIAYGNGITLEYPVASNIFEPIRGSQLTVSVKNTDNFDYKEFFGSDYAYWKAELIDVTAANAVIWTGYSQAENYNEPFIDFPYPSNLTFTCGLGELKNYTFDNSGTLYTGQKHLIEIIRLCTNQLNALEVQDSFNVYAASHNRTASDSALVQSYVNSSIFREINEQQEEGLNCYDVLKHICTSLGCFITQYNNQWWVVRSKEQTGSLYYKTFAAASGAESGTTSSGSGTEDIQVDALDVNDEMTFILSDAQMNIEQRIRKVIYKFRPQRFQLTSLIQNGNFNSKWGINSATLPLRWTRSGGMTTSECRAIFQANEYKLIKEEVNIPFGSGQLTTSIETSEDGEIYMLFDHTAGDIWTGPDQSRDVTDYVEIIGDDCYLTNGDKLRISSEYRNNTVTHMVLPYTLIVHDYGTATDYYFDGLYQSTSSIQGDIFIGNVEDIWQSYVSTNSQSPIIPFTGRAKITLRLHKTHAYNPGTTSVAFGTVVLKNINIFYEYADATSPDYEQIKTYTLDNYKDDYTINAWIGQGLKYGDECALRASNGDLLIEWDRRDPSTGTVASEDLTLCTIVPSEVLDLKGEFNKRISGTLYRQSKIITPITRVAIPVPEGAGTTTIYASVLGFTWNISKAYFKTTMSEINEVTQVPTTNSTAHGGTTLLPSGGTRGDDGTITDTTSGTSGSANDIENTGQIPR